MNKVILIGKAAAGKDHMRKVLEGRGFIYGTSYTTRPPREGEIDGQDYYFVSEDEFTRLASQNFWYEYVEFNGWFYGTSHDQFKNTCDLFVMTPKGVEALNPIDRKQFLRSILKVASAWDLISRQFVFYPTIEKIVGCKLTI